MYVLSATLCLLHDVSRHVANMTVWGVHRAQATNYASERVHFETHGRINRFPGLTKRMPLMFSKCSKIEPTHNGAYLMSPIFLDVKEPSVENADDVFCPTFFSVWFVFW